MPSHKAPLAVYQLTSQPGIQRDGTNLSSKRYADGQWVRFQRGMPKKMGGYRACNHAVNGPIRALYTWSRQELTQVTSCSPWGIEALLIDSNGVGQSLYDRTPTGYQVDGLATWQLDSMYDAAALSTRTLLFAFQGSNLNNLDSLVDRDIYYGDATGTNPLVAIGGTALVSGGFVCASPYLVIFGSDGRISWSNENEPRNFTTGAAGTARIGGTKIVKGLPIRGQGTSPSVLLWSLDSIIRMSYTGGQAVFRFDPVTNASSILSPSSVVEYDGVYYWIGINRFLMYNGRIQELPNDQNLNWFFDGLNYAQRQKVHAVKVPRYGEIWWFFPKDDAIECSHAVIYNVREGYWYDVQLNRSAGYCSNTFRYPLLTDSTVNKYVDRIPVSDTSAFIIGDTVTGSTSLASGTLLKANGGYLYVSISNNVTNFISGETVSGVKGGAQTVISNSLDVPLYQLWLHEFGKDCVDGDYQVGLPSFFETNDFGFPLGGVGGTSPMGPNSWTRLVRVEPDFKMVGEMRMQVISRESADSQVVATKAYAFDSTTETIDIRNQSRELRLRFESSEAGSDYEMGRVLMHLEEGDGRS